MSKHYTAYQYEAAYRARALRNWEVPKFFCNRPRQRTGMTKIIANATGNLLPGVHRSEDSPWGNFIGTWHMPRKIDRKTASILNGSAEFKTKAQKCYLHYSYKPPVRLPELVKEESEDEFKVMKEDEKPIKEQGAVEEVAKDVEVEEEKVVAEEEAVARPLCPIHDV